MKCMVNLKGHIHKMLGLK